MFDFNKTGEAMVKRAKDAAGQAVVEATSLVEAATKEADALGNLFGSLGKVKTPEDATNLLISYNTQLFQRSSAACTKAIERMQVYSTLAQTEFAKAAKA